MEELPKQKNEHGAEQLPVTTLAWSPRDERFKGTISTEHFLIKAASGETIGEGTLSISRPTKGEQTAYLNTIAIHEDLRGHGYGKSAYVQLIQTLKDQGITLTSGFQLSRGTAKIWDWLVTEKRAKKTKTGEINEEAENAGYSSSEYEAL